MLALGKAKRRAMIQGIIICFVYVALLTALSKLSGIKYTDLIKNEHNIKKGMLIPIGIGTLLLTIYAFVRDFIPTVFTYTPRFSNLLLWIVPVVIILGILLRVPRWNLRSFTKRSIIYLVLGAFIVGFSEELLVRGIFVNLLQQSGYSVLVVGLLSSVIFGVMHGINFLTGQNAKTTAGQMFTTTLIGFNFYVVLVLTGSLWVPIVLHALHDLSLFLCGGEINKTDGEVSKQELATTLTLLALAPISAVIVWLA